MNHGAFAAFPPRWRKVLRDLWLHKSRTALVVVAIAVGVVGAGAILNTWALVQRVTREAFLASNPASATLRTDSIDAALLARVRAMPGVRDAQARRTVFGRARGRGGWSTAILFVLDDFSDVRIGKLRPEAGTWPPPDGTFTIERSSLAFSGAAVGEPLTVLVGNSEPVELPVTGIARDVGLAPGWMEHVVYGFTTRATLDKLGTPSSLNELQIVTEEARDRDAIRRLAYDVKAEIERTGRRVTDVLVPEPGEHIHAGQMNSLLYTQGAFGILALLLSGFLVVNLISAMLTGQVREIGVMKAIGARSGQIAFMYLGVALVLGLVASGLALPTAVFIGRRYAELKAELLNFDVTGYAIPAWAIALQVAVSALLPVAAAAIPVVRGSRTTVADALRDVGIEGGAGANGWLSRVRGPARPLLLSLRNAFRRRQRMILTLVSLAMGGAVYLGALNLRAAVRGAVDLLYSAMHFDFALRLSQSGSPDSIEAILASIPGVSGGEAWSGTRAAVAREDGTVGNAFIITAPPPGSRMIVPVPATGRWLRADDERALVVNSSLLNDDPSVVVGGELTMIVAGQAATWTVVGSVESGPGPAAFASRRVIAGLVSEGLVDRAVVATSIEGLASQVDLIQRVRSELENRGFQVQSTQLLAENRRVMEDHLLMVADFLGAMAWVMIVVGGLGLASTMSLAVLERTREIGVLRAIGARHRSILTIVQVEGLVIALLSWVIAVPVSLPISVVLGWAFGQVMLPLPVTWIPQGAAVLWWLALVVLVSLLACAWPAFRAMRVPTAAALAYE